MIRKFQIVFARQNLTLQKIRKKYQKKKTKKIRKKIPKKKQIKKFTESIKKAARIHGKRQIKLANWLRGMRFLIAKTWTEITVEEREGVKETERERELDKIKRQVWRI